LVNLIKEEEKINLSLIIPAYNNSFQLNNLLDSILDQINSNIEIIIIDDGSSNPIKSKYSNKIIKIFRTENMGPSHARNYGSSRAKGEYLLFIDSDLIFPDGMLKKIYDFSIKNKYEVVSIFYSSEPANKGIAQKFKASFDYYNNVYNQKDGYIISFQGSSCLFKKEIFIKTNGWSTNFKLASLENEEFASRIIKSNVRIYFTKNLHLSHTFPNFYNLLRVIFIRTMIWVQLKIKKEVKYDNLVRTPYKGIVAALTLPITIMLILIYMNSEFVYFFFTLLIAYILCNFGFYTYLYRNNNIINFLMGILIMFAFQLTVTLGAISGLIINKFHKVKK
jgi:glycosyltransferase involved in cell wall biosynthesis